MNFNVYLNKSIGERLTKAVNSLHRNRNSIISEAVEEWLERHAYSKWPKGFFDFKPIKNVPNFKKLRSDFWRTGTDKKPVEENPQNKVASKSKTQQ